MNLEFKRWLEKQEYHFYSGNTVNGDDTKRDWCVKVEGMDEDRISDYTWKWEHALAVGKLYYDK